MFFSLVNHGFPQAFWPHFRQGDAVEWELWEGRIVNMQEGWGQSAGYKLCITNDLTNRPKPIDDGEWIRGIIPKIMAELFR